MTYRFLILFCIIHSIKAVSQDILHKKNGEQLRVQVIEINKIEIKYKKYDNLKGNTISIPKTDVFVIKYANGSREFFNVNESTKVNDNYFYSAPSSLNRLTYKLYISSVESTGPFKINGEGWTYFRDGQLLSDKYLLNILNEANETKITNTFSAGVGMQKTGRKLGIISIPTMLGGVVFLIAGIDLMGTYNKEIVKYNQEISNNFYPGSPPEDKNYQLGSTLMGIGYGIIGTGGAMLTTSFVLKLGSKKNYKKAIELYNATL